MSSRIPFPIYPASVIQETPAARNAFEICFAELGGPVPISAGKVQILGAEWFRRRYWDYLTKFRTIPFYRQALRHMYIDYVNNSALNAVVSSYDNLGLVGLFLGAVENLGTFFNLLLSHPELFPEIGDPSKQRIWFEDLSAWDWKLSLALAWEAFIAKRSNEPTYPEGERRQFAGYLQMFALDFLLFHELGHWCNGHDLYVARFKKDFMISELGMEQLPAVPSQLLELNADSFAVILMTNEWFQMKFDSLSIFQSPLEALRLWATAMAFTFILFGQEREIHIVRPMGFHPHPELLSIYPHPAIRLLNMRQTAMNVARMFSSSAVSIMDQALNEGISAAIEVCNKLRMPSSIWYAESETINRTYQALMLEWGMLYNSEITACTRTPVNKGK